MQAIPQDFLQALHTHQLSLRSLLPHLDPPIPPSRSQYQLQTETAEADQNQHLNFLGPLLSSGRDENAKRFVPKHFPDLPSKHTYKETPEFPDREQDPRKIREKATEEGRLGEEALRRLVGASSSGLAQQAPQSEEKMSARERRDQIWKETMNAVMKNTHGEKGKQKEGESASLVIGDGRLSSVVNAEKKYWRKPAPRSKDLNNGSV